MKYFFIILVVYGASCAATKKVSSSGVKEERRVYENKSELAFYREDDMLIYSESISLKEEEKDVFKKKPVKEFIHNCNSELDFYVDPEVNIENSSSTGLYNSDTNININKPKYIKAFTLVCYIGPSKIKMDRSIKKAYRILETKLVNMHLKREYRENYYILTLGEFLTELEILPLKYLFKNSRIKIIKKKNTFTNIQRILSQKIL